MVSTRHPAFTAWEIDRVADDSGFVQVLPLVRSEHLHGERRYWPIYEAAIRHGLPVCTAGGSDGHPITPVGWPSYYLEDDVRKGAGIPGIRPSCGKRSRGHYLKPMSLSSDIWPGNL